MDRQSTGHLLHAATLAVGKGVVRPKIIPQTDEESQSNQQARQVMAKKVRKRSTVLLNQMSWGANLPERSPYLSIGLEQDRTYVLA